MTKLELLNQCKAAGMRPSQIKYLRRRKNIVIKMTLEAWKEKQES